MKDSDSAGLLWVEHKFPIEVAITEEFKFLSEFGLKQEWIQAP
jgi:hypothetical protein